MVYSPLRPNSTKPFIRADERRSTFRRFLYADSEGFYS
jgi:hypothetical protein